MSKSRWEQFNYIARECQLTTTEKSLLLLIFSYINAENGYCSLSVSELMRMTPIKDRKTFFNTRQSLVEKRFLNFETIKGKGCKYYVSIPSREIQPSGKNQPSRETQPTPSREIKPTPSRKTLPQKENKNKIKENIYSDLIKKYPGKKIKSVRDKKLPKILKEYSIEEIERCINRYAEECKGRDKKFILNESTFWNGRYIDYLDENFEEITKPKEMKEKDIGDLMEQLMANREE